MIRKYRDLSIYESSGSNFVIACDTSASIGEKEYDALSAPNEIVASFCLRVPLLELMAFNAEPILLINLFSNEMQPSGEKMLAAIHSELRKAGYENLPMTGSTEENMPTYMTAMGIVILGTFDPMTAKWKACKSGDLLVQVGRPYVGAEVLENLTIIPGYEEIIYLRNLSTVHEIVPIGSKGAIYEAKELAKLNNLEFFESYSDDDLDLHRKTAGPATSFLLAIDSAVLEKLQSKFTFVKIIGALGDLAI